MKKLVLFLCLLFSSVVAFADEYQVIRIYEKQSVKYDVKAIDTYGEIKEISYLLVPTKIDEGTYSVQLTRKDTNIYSIEGTDLFIETQFCYEYCFSEEAVLIVKNYNNLSVGKVVFVN